MFTGIIRHVGTVTGIRGAAPRRLSVDAGPLTEGLGEGDSLAVSGVCLTVAGLRGAVCQFDVVAQTLAHTTLGALRAGRRVNLERSLRASDALDGHLVLGHVDGMAVVRRIKTSGERLVEFKCAAELAAQMVPKGSVALDGVSLTLVDVGDRGFAVALIPTTLNATTLDALRVGQPVNVETDIIGKYVQKHLRGPSRPSLTLDKLREAGF